MNLPLNALGFNNSSINNTFTDTKTQNLQNSLANLERRIRIKN